MADQVDAEAQRASPGNAGRGLNALPRAVAVVVSCVVIFAALALVGTEVLAGGVREEAVIGLTDESEWPFHDVHLATAASRLDDPSFVTDLQADLGLPANPDAVSLDRDRTSGDGVLVVRAEAATGEEAAALVNATADAMVVGPDLPLFVADRAAGRAEPIGRAASAGAGALVGLLVGLVAAPRRRVADA